MKEISETSPAPKVITAAEAFCRRNAIVESVVALARDMHVSSLENPYPDFEAAGWERNEATLFLFIGNEQIHPSLIFNDSPGSERLKNVRPLLREQVEVIENGVEVVSLRTGETRPIPLHQITRKQAKQVFSRNGPRNPEEQRAWLKKKFPHVVAAWPIATAA